MVRFKRRYILFRIDWADKPAAVSFKQIPKQIQEEVERQFGDYGGGLTQGQIICLLLNHLLILTVLLFIQFSN